MAKFWKRKAEVLVAGKKYILDDFEIDFKVEFDDDPEPNISEIAIYNLSNDSISTIKKGSNIILNAGYEGDVGTILLGKVEKPETTWEGVDKKTNILIGEGSDVWMKAYVSKTYAPGITSKAILSDLSGQFGMELGDFRLTKDITYMKGKSVSGMLQTIMREVVKDTGSKFHISKGKIYIRTPEAGDNTGFLLSADTGLLESPTPFEEDVDGKTISGYRVKMLLNHRITVDSILQIQSKTANGMFRVWRGTHYGDFITEVEVVAV
jgi:hypothetical protein